MLFFIRHGETSWNAEGRLQGQVDIELNAHGREQARETARMLARVAPEVGTAEFIVSPMSRARETAEIVMAELVALGSLKAPRPYTTDDRLKELRYGRWEGLSWKDVKERDPEAYRLRKANAWDIEPPDGESYADLAARVKPLLMALPQGTVVVAHGGINRVALEIFAGAEPNRAAAAFVRQGDVLIVDGGHARWGSGAAVDGLDT